MGDEVRSESAARPSPPAGTIPALLYEWASRTPQAAALRAPGQGALSYGGLWDLVLRTAMDLAASGLEHGDRVALVLPNGPEAAAAFLSTTAVASCAPLNPAYRSSELRFFLEDVRAKAVIVSREDSRSEARRAAEQLGIAIIELEPVAGREAGPFRLALDPADALPSHIWPQPETVALLLHTSGTTSRPKLVPLTHANLFSSATHIAATLQLGPRDCCLNVMPLFHIHGLMAALLASLRAGASVACTPGFYATNFFEWLRDLKPTWYTAVPTMHQAILERAAENQEILGQVDLRFVRSSSASLPTRVLRELEQVFRAPAIESYGMTEASHQMASNPLPPQVRKPGSVGPAAGPKVAIMDPQDRLLGQGQAGEIVIRGPNVTRAYENNPEANAGSFIGGWFRTGDEGLLDEDGYLFLTGRIKEIINKGGEKIAPREIEEIVLEHPGVSQAVAFSLPDPRLGEDVGLAVVLKPGQTASEQELRRFASRRLADFKVPARVVILDEIPKGPTGKLQRIGLAERLGLGVESQPPDRRAAEQVPPRTPTERALAALWCEVLRRDRVGIHERFLDVGGDSMLATLLLSRIRARMQIKLDMVNFFAAPSVAEQAELIDAVLFSDLEAGGRP